MTRGGRRRAAKATTCLSCGAILDSVRPFCDEECERYAQAHGYAHYGAAKTPRGIPLRANTVRRDYR